MNRSGSFVSNFNGHIYYPWKTFRHFRNRKFSISFHPHTLRPSRRFQSIQSKLRSSFMSTQTYPHCPSNLSRRFTSPVYHVQVTSTMYQYHSHRAAPSTSIVYFHRPFRIQHWTLRSKLQSFILDMSRVISHTTTKRNHAPRHTSTQPPVTAQVPHCGLAHTATLAPGVLDTLASVTPLRQFRASLLSMSQRHCNVFHYYYLTLHNDWECCCAELKLQSISESS